MDISIIIPLYNTEDFLLACLQSVAELQYGEKLNIECIIVDDKSTDSSLHLAKEFVNSYSGRICFKLLCKDTNSGLSDTRNLGIQIAKGRYLYFLDSDDLISKNCMQLLWNYTLLIPDVNMVIGPTQCFPDKSQLKAYLDLNKSNFEEIATNRRSFRNYYFTLPDISCNKLINREWLLKNNLYFNCGFICEDYYWFLRSYEYLQTIAIAKNCSPTYFYRQRETSIMNSSARRKLNDVRHLIYLDFAVRAPLQDKRMAGLYLQVLLLYRKENLSTYFDELYNKLSSNPRITIAGRLLFLLMKAPKRVLNHKYYQRVFYFLQERFIA